MEKGETLGAKDCVLRVAQISSDVNEMAFACCIFSLLHAIGVNDIRRYGIGQGGRTRKSYRD